MKEKIFALSILAILLLGCDENNEPNPAPIINTGQSIQKLIHNNVAREFIIYIPATYDETTEVPLLFNFHGYGGEMNDYMDYADMRSVSDAENFILVYPQGTLLQGSSHWNPSLPHPDNKSDADDLGFIETLINELSSVYMIDSERIYACGYSNGAMMSYGLAFHKSDLIAAVGSVSGTMLDADIIPSHPMPVVSIHGTSDKVLPYIGSSDFNSMETVLNFWIGFNNTNTTPILNSANDNGTTIEHYQYSEGDHDVSVEHYKIIGGDHIWFYINYQGSNTGKLIWDFVSKYDINGLR